MRHPALFFRTRARHGLEDDEAARKDLHNFMAVAADDDQQARVRTAYLPAATREAIVQLIEKPGNPAYEVHANGIGKRHETHEAPAMLKE